MSQVADQSFKGQPHSKAVGHVLQRDEREQGTQLVSEKCWPLALIALILAPEVNMFGCVQWLISTQFSPTVLSSSCLPSLSVLWVFSVGTCNQHETNAECSLNYHAHFRVKKTGSLWHQRHHKGWVCCGMREQLAPDLSSVLLCAFQQIQKELWILPLKSTHLIPSQYVFFARLLCMATAACLAALYVPLLVLVGWFMLKT